MKVALFIDGVVGKNIAYIFKKYAVTVDILILNHGAEQSYKECVKAAISYLHCFEYRDFLCYVENCDSEKLFDIGLLCWWPFIVKEELINKANIGFLNFHPSLLPYGRGKHPNFWTFVDNTPFGVTIHWVNNTIDGGDIAFQSEIKKNWMDTGETLYKKALNEIVNLFEANFSEIMNGTIPKIPQKANLLIRYSKELDIASEIILDKEYTANELINLLRARTFLGYSGCWFEVDGKRYQITVTIKEN